MFFLVKKSGGLHLPIFYYSLLIIHHSFRASFACQLFSLRKKLQKSKKRAFLPPITSAFKKTSCASPSSIFANAKITRNHGAFL